MNPFIANHRRQTFLLVLLIFLASPLATRAQEESIPLLTGDEGGETFVSEVPVSTDSATIQTPVSNEIGLTPDAAYRQLAAGNARYLKEASEEALALRQSNASSQYPIATILYSLDMPTLPTTLTQTTDHNVYLSGLQSGSVSVDDMAAIEYGILNLQTPLLVVMGHFPSRDIANLIRQYDDLDSQARAELKRISDSKVETLPKGTLSDEMKLYTLVGPAIARSKEAYPDLQNSDLANVVSEALVWQSLETILLKSTVAQDLVRSGNLMVIAAIADDKTGKIYWLGEHPLQEEFLTPPPEELQNTNSQDNNLTESELPEPLNNTRVQEYVAQYEANTYYNDVVSEYYVQPVYYAPSWELFSDRAWTYRPWYGVWVDSFAPWPYWNPWVDPYGTTGVGLSIWSGGLSFYIGYNRYVGPYRPWNPDFRPRSPWWNLDIFINPSGHWRDPVFDLVWRGERGHIHHVPPHERPYFTPGPRGPFPPDRHFSPGAMRPNDPRAPFFSPFGRDPRGYRPGDARPGGLRGGFNPPPKDRPGAGSSNVPNPGSGNPPRREVNPGSRPGNGPNGFPARPGRESDPRNGNPPRREANPGSRPGNNPNGDPAKPGREFDPRNGNPPRREANPGSRPGNNPNGGPARPGREFDPRNGNPPRREANPGSRPGNDSNGVFPRPGRESGARGGAQPRRETGPNPRPGANSINERPQFNGVEPRRGGATQTPSIAVPQQGTRGVFPQQGATPRSTMDPSPSFSRSGGFSTGSTPRPTTSGLGDRGTGGVGFPTASSARIGPSPTRPVAPSFGDRGASGGFSPRNVSPAPSVRNGGFPQRGDAPRPSAGGGSHGPGRGGR